MEASFTFISDDKKLRCPIVVVILLLLVENVNYGSLLIPLQ
jgi:hypothetical protein